MIGDESGRRVLIVKLDKYEAAVRIVNEDNQSKLGLKQRTCRMSLFELENQMAPPVLRWLRSQQLTVRQEFQVPWGICDFVGVKLNAKRVKKRLAYGQKQPVGPPIRLHILSKIPDVSTGLSTTVDELHRTEFGHLSMNFLHGELRRLAQLKFVSITGEEGFQRLNGWAPLHNRIVVVELKLSRITEVLAQASSNRTFATESYVGLPATLARRLAKGHRAEEFRSRGVGILAVSNDECRLVLRSSDTSEMVDDVLQAHCVERFWRVTAKPS